MTIQHCLRPKSFNPRSHEGTDIRFFRVRDQFRVSIHVPTRGTTQKPVVHTSDHEVSIHVPTRGTTEHLWLWCQLMKFQSTFPRGERLHLSRNGFLADRFNPRSHEGNDPKSGDRKGVLAMVSIHVPTRGTTHFRICTCRFGICFNPRSHEGNDAFW